MENYYLTLREKKIARMVRNKGGVKNYNYNETVFLRWIICAAVFLNKFVDKYWPIVHRVISYLSFSELAILCIVMRELGFPNFFAYLRYNQHTKTLLRCIFLNSSNNELDHKLIINYQLSQHNLYVCPFKSDCMAFIEKILTSEVQLLSLARTLLPITKIDRFDSLNLGYITADYDINLIKFNPVYELGAYITNTFTWVFCYGGKSRENVGQIVYRFEKTNMSKHLGIEWSPDGTYLLLLSKNNVGGEAIVFKYLSGSGIMRKLKLTPNIGFDVQHCSSRLWCGPNSFMVIAPHGQLIRYNFGNANIQMEILFPLFTASIGGPEVYTRLTEPQLKTLFGSFTCCPSDKTLIAFLKPCCIVPAHVHEVVVLLRINSVNILPIIYVSAPGFILEFTFYKSSQELWFLWKENANEVWSSFTFQTCKVSLPGYCPLINEIPTVKTHQDLNWTVEYDLKACTNLGVGHYALEENLFYELISFRSNPKKTLRTSWKDFQILGYCKGTDFWMRTKLTSFDQKFILTDHFVALTLADDQSMLTTYRVSICKYLMLLKRYYKYSTNLIFTKKYG